MEDVGIPMDALTREVTLCGHHVPVLRVVGQLVGLCHGVDVRRDGRVIADALDPLSVHVGPDV